MTEYKIIEKPWGKEEFLHLDQSYMMKRLTMHKGHRCSLQYHEKKTETVYILSGKLKIYLGTNKDCLEEKIFEKNQSITILPFQIHRMEALEDCIYLEASTPEVNDVVRIQDDYNRNK